MRFLLFFLLTLVLVCPLWALEKEHITRDKETIFDKNREFPLTSYNPLYFLDGYPDAKVMLSFKYQFMRSLDLFLGYNQVMFWELHEPSKPFKDVNFNPHLFYRWRARAGVFDAVQFGFYEHKSNGKGGEESRSSDSVYLKFSDIYLLRNFLVSWKLKIFALYNLDDTNADIREYAGIWQAEVVTAVFFESALETIALALRFNAGDTYGIDPGKGAIEGMLVFRFNFRHAHPAVCFQVFHGYGESMLLYDKKRTSYRVGLLLFI